jgi:hypothetical protein
MTTLPVVTYERVLCMEINTKLVYEYTDEPVHSTFKFFMSTSARWRLSKLWGRGIVNAILGRILNICIECRCLWVLRTPIESKKNTELCCTDICRSIFYFHYNNKPLEKKKTKPFSGESF